MMKSLKNILEKKMNNKELKIITDNYIIYQGDCLEIMDQLIKQNVKVDAIICDPPYGIDFKSNHRKEKYEKISNDNDLSFLDEYFQKCNKLLNEDTHVYCFCSWHHIDKFKIAFEKYFKLKNIIVWEKNNTSMGDLMGHMLLNTNLYYLDIRGEG